MMCVCLTLEVLAAPQDVPGNRVSREGLTIEFTATPLDASELMEAATAEIALRITDAQSGKPVQGLYPVVWIDIGAAFDALHSKNRTTTCKDRAGLYLQGLVGMRPLIDLNSYFVMVMNQDPTITVIDPIIGIQGRTNLYAQIVLKRAGADWVKTDDEKRLFVSMPVADMVGGGGSRKVHLDQQRQGQRYADTRRAAAGRKVPLGRERFPQAE